MKHSPSRLLFVLGNIALAGGYLLLLFTLGGLDLLSRLWPVLPTLAGLVLLLIFLIHPSKPRPRFLLGGSMNFLLGGLTLGLNLFWQDAWGSWLQLLWPLYMVLIGIAFVPYAFQYKRKLRVTLMIPAWVMLVLGGIFLVYSLRWIQGDLAGFVATWWPILFLILGGTLLLAYWFQHTAVSKDEGVPKE